MALRYLTQREYSRAELRNKLLEKTGGGDKDALEQLLDQLQEQNLLSDQRYAETRVRMRAGRLGNARLKYELAQQGVSAEEIDSALEQVGDETQRCRSVWRKKYAAPPSSKTERARQMRFLHYRGFSTEAVRKVFNNPEDDA